MINDDNTWAEAIRILRGKKRLESECKHEGKLDPIDGCEYCGARILRVPIHLIKALRELKKFEDVDGMQEDEK